MKGKVVYVGWMGRNDFNRFKKSWNRQDIGIAEIPSLFRGKGKKADWAGYGWPPEKVKITVESLDI